MPDLDLSSVDGLAGEAAHELVRWILSEGVIEALGDDPAREVGRPARFIDALCCRLISASVPLWRVTVYAATLHPQLRGFGWRWRRDGRGAEEVHLAQDTELTDDLEQSPLRGTIEQGLTLHCGIDRGNSVSPPLRKFRADGCTEYLTVPLNRIGGNFPVVARATGDKIMRLRSQTAKIEGGFILFPKEAPWLDIYLHELLTFPNYKKDDQVDATVYALAWITENPRWSGWTDESIAGLERFTDSLYWQSQLWALARR